MSRRHRRGRLAMLSFAAGLTIAPVAVLTLAFPAAAPPRATERPDPAFADVSPVDAVPARAFHVAIDGNDRAAGSRNAPLRSIGEAVERVPVGGTVVVHAGSYHESIEIEEPADITLMAAPGATVWLDGSRPVRTWLHSGGAWVSTGWTPEFDASPTYTRGEPDNDEPHWRFVDPAYPMAAHPDQVWIDDAPQTQVRSRDRLRPGAFYVDEGADRLYLGSDPTGRSVRASDIAKALSVRAAGTQILGIGVRRYASSVPHMGSVTVEAPRVRLEDVTIEENATTGLHVMEPDVRLVGVSLVDNGMMGMTTNGADGLRVDRLRVTGNNRERFNASPAAGGVKIGRGSDVVVRDSVFDRNLGTGLWFDESVYGIEVIGSRMTGNAGHGISLELSGKVVVAGNVVAGNGASGLKINDTNDVSVWNNTFAGNHREIDIAQDSRDLDPEGSHLDRSLPLTFRNGPVVLRNNVIAQTAPDSDCLLCVEDHSGRMSAEQMRISARGNLYQRPSDGRPAVLVLWSRGDGAEPFGSLAAFRGSTGQEQPGSSLTGGSVLREDYSLTRQVDQLAATTAVPLPAAIAARLGVPPHTRALGAG